MLTAVWRKDRRKKKRDRVISWKALQVRKAARSLKEVLFPWTGGGRHKVAR